MDTTTSVSAENVAGSASGNTAVAGFQPSRTRVNSTKVQSASTPRSLVATTAAAKPDGRRTPVQTPTVAEALALCWTLLRGGTEAAQAASRPRNDQVARAAQSPRTKRIADKP
jgi:hypothetical protein